MSHSNNDNSHFKSLHEIEQETDWDDLVNVIYLYYVKSKTKHIVLTIESMLRIYILSRYFEMSPSSIEKALLQKDILRDFALIDIDEIPNKDSITDFSSLLFEQTIISKIECALRKETTKAELVTIF